ncbi:MAG: hypothetical protein GEV08_10050 [Acidimicrobiia bacterium]|nr:hypothetical protein [Acidimicrobiia bacterium]
MSCPALVVWGGADRLLPPAHGHELARGLGLDGAVVLDGAGHLATVDSPAAIAALTWDFAQRIDVESTAGRIGGAARRIDVESTGTPAGGSAGAANERS